MPSAVTPFLQSLSLLGLLLLLSNIVHAEGELKPYVLGSSGTGMFAAKTADTKKALEAHGFSLVGEYTPYDGAQILVVSNAELQKLAANSDFGGYGAAQRIAITQVGAQVQVSYTNPLYMREIYRMQGDFNGVVAALETALGKQQSFGSEEGLSAEELRDYHYMVFMPYFDDAVEIAKFASHAEAVKAVEAGLAAGKGNTAQVYKVSVDGKEEILFGVALKDGEAADTSIMQTIDKGKLRHTAHLPYDLLVSGKAVYILHGKFRIAQSFPDLSMGTFMDISGAPDAIKEAMRAVVDK